MARSVTKSLASATIYVFDPSRDFSIGEDGMPLPNRKFVCDGNPSENKARILAEKHCKSKNVMVVRIEVDETKLNVTPETFYANSEECDPDATYGREFVTQTFKITLINGFYIDTAGMHSFTVDYFGVTTDSKLLSYVREQFGQRATITHAAIVEERRYMTRERYIELAK